MHCQPEFDFSLQYVFLFYFAISGYVIEYKQVSVRPVFKEVMIMNNNVHSPSEQVAVRAATYSGQQNSQSSRSSRSAAPASRSGKPVEISISDIGRQMAQAMGHSSIHTAGEARASLETIKTQLAKAPETTRVVHSNLRALRINHLIFD